MEAPLSAEALHAIAHPIRLAALATLEERPRDRAALAQALDVAPPVLMHHLHVLDTAGLVVRGGDGVLRTTRGGWRELAGALEGLQEEAGGEG